MKFEKKLFAAFSIEFSSQWKIWMNEFGTT